ncbi:MAG: HIT domain-containing protein [Leptospiraceae bacterium]|nr:HIT domain-containing protein [Leptospiraceae bacterium]
MNDAVSIGRKIGQRIKELRAKRGLTQEKLAEISGIDSKHIQLLESAKPTNAKIGTIKNISEAFGLSLEEFFQSSIFLEKKISNKKSNVFTAKSGLGVSWQNRERIFEDNLSFAIFEPSPVNRGHILIIPKRNFKNYFESYTEEKHSFLEMIERARDYLIREYKPDGFNIGFDLEEVAGQNHSQFCIHVIPRYKGDTTQPSLSGIKNIKK